MGRAYLRRCVLTVDPGTGALGRQIKDLRMTFSVEKTTASSENTCQVQVYNLAPASRQFIEGVPSTKGSIILAAGYEPETPVGPQRSRVIFRGDVTKVRSSRQGTEIVTEIEARDGGNAFATSIVSESAAAGTSMADVVRKTTKPLAAKGLKLPNLADVERWVSGKFAEHGFSLFGSPRRYLDQFARTLGGRREWWVTDGELVLSTGGDPLAGAAVLLSPLTGLIGPPVLVGEDHDAATEEAEAADHDIELTSLLNAEIQPGKAVQLESDALTAVLRVEKVTHTGDTHGGEWTSQVEARNLSALQKPLVTGTTVPDFALA